MHTHASEQNGQNKQDRKVGFIPIWLDIGYRLGRPTYLGIYLQTGFLNKSQTCGIARHGPDPYSDTDADPRFGYTNCMMLKAGVDFVVHTMPRTIIDPFFGFDVGVQGTLTKYSEYDPVTRETSGGHDDNAAVQPGFQLGVDVHPTAGWGFGLFAHTAVHFGSEGKASGDKDTTSNSGNACAPNTGPGTPNPCQSSNQCSGDCGSSANPGYHLLFGTRIAYTFQ
jgi:hypothetical protein